jgi:hypothetical protein
MADQFIEQLMQQAVLMGEAQAAAYRAGDNDGESARKLRRLIAAAEEAAPQLECVDIRSAEKLRAAIAEARKP